MKVQDNLTRIEQEIQSACKKKNRSRSEIKIIAVTKYVTPERAREAMNEGIDNFGENRPEGLLAKQEVLGDKPVWHFIGSLQSRKVKTIIDKVDYIHSLDRLSLAEEIQKRANKQIKCFVQVNSSGEASKHGLSPAEVIHFIHALKSFDKIQVVGLMTMAPNTDDEVILRECFRTLKELRDQIENLKLDYAPCHELSMGMSNDFGIAIEEGSTMVRIGTALVGE